MLSIKHIVVAWYIK